MEREATVFFPFFQFSHYIIIMITIKIIIKKWKKRTIHPERIVSFHINYKQEELFSERFVSPVHAFVPLYSVYYFRGYVCYKTVYTTQAYTVACGIWKAFRCTRYR